MSSSLFASCLSALLFALPAAASPADGPAPVGGTVSLGAKTPGRIA